MCDECGCEETIVIDKSVTEDNDMIAHDTWHKLKGNGVFCVNVLGSPGSGKTTVIENLANILGASNMFVIQGDLESDVDKKRLEDVGISGYQINTHSGCHLSAQMIDDALKNCDITGKKFLFIENVGNLVCPAGVNIGQHVDLVVSSTTEGSDKPKKYPVIFRGAGVVVISKMDIALMVDFDDEEYLKDITLLNPKARIVKTEKGSDSGFKEIANILNHRREHLLSIEHKH